MIILGPFDAKPVEFGVEPADALEDADIARLAKCFADHFRLHQNKLAHYPAKVKPNLSLFLRLNHVIVLSMGADEKPNHRVSVHDTESTIIVRYPGRPVDPHFLKPHRRVVGIVQPKPVLYCLVASF
ncbi:MAG: hypothetical protein LV480_02055 [Methylacidiphilales bacterium]|nr:hypothetical protein [Candidatus Methylacidiphilales bacterium]